MPIKTFNTWTPAHTTLLSSMSRGHTVKEAADAAGIDELRAKSITKSPRFKVQLARVQERVIEKVVADRPEITSLHAVIEARQVLTDHAVTAAIMICKIAQDPDAKSRAQLEACKDILDRVGLRPVVITETRERVYSPEEVASARKILGETQAIIERLSNQTSPFVLGDTSQVKLASSVTDISSSGSELPKAAS